MNSGAGQSNRDRKQLEREWSGHRRHDSEANLVPIFGTIERREWNLEMEPNCFAFQNDE